ncbi:hypothetical protein COP2_044748 [Malus domestica]
MSSNQHNINSTVYIPIWRLLRRNLSSEILHPFGIKSYGNARKWVLDILVSRLKTKCKGWWAWLLVLAILGLVVDAVILAIVKKVKKNSGGYDSAVPEPSSAITQKYFDILKLAVQFFDVQKSGHLVDNKISWRGESGLKNGSNAKLDLSKGMYDVGDHMKFGFPMAYTATVLSWAILEYGDQMDALRSAIVMVDEMVDRTKEMVEAMGFGNRIKAVPALIRATRE